MTRKKVNVPHIDYLTKQELYPIFNLMTDDRNTKKKEKQNTPNGQKISQLSQKISQNSRSKLYKSS